MADPKIQKSIQVNIPEHLKAATSANIVRVTTTDMGEVILDFVFSHPQDVDVEKAVQIGTLVSRIILNKQVARDLQIILTNHLGKIGKE